MPQSLQAVFENGVFRPLVPLKLPEQKLVTLTVSRAETEDRPRTGEAGRRSSPTSGPKTLPSPIEPSGRARGSTHQKRNGHRRWTSAPGYTK